MSQEAIRTLEQLRQRLNSLAQSIGKLRLDLEANDPLPSWPSIQNSAVLLSHNLRSLQATLSSAQPLLISAHAYPLPAFPGRTQEDLLGQLLRKKLQPQVEDWIEAGTRHASVFLPGANASAQTDGSTNAASTNGTHTEDSGLTGQQWEDLWNFAGPEGNRIARDMGSDVFDDLFTIAEHEEGIETVVTGLRRKLWDSDDEGEDDGEEKDKVDGMDIDLEEKKPMVVEEKTVMMRRAGEDETKPPMNLEAVLRFAITGVDPTAPGPGQLRR